MLLQVEDYEPVDINHRRHLREHGGDWHHQRRYQLKGNIFLHILKFSLEIKKRHTKHLYAEQKSLHTWNEVKWNKQ